MILAFVDHDRGVPDEASVQALTLGRRLAEHADTTLEAATIGPEARPLAERLGSYGVAAAHVVDHAGLDAFAPDAWAEILAQLVAALAPEAVVAAGTDRGNEILARLGARSDLPLAANCIEVEPGDAYRVTRLRWGGSLLEEATLEGGTKLLTVAPHVVHAEETPAHAAADILAFEPALPDEVFRVRVTARVEPQGGKVSLGEARVVVGGGRGLGSADGFIALEALGELLGGPVGCSRAVTSLGWRPHSDQIGQTGNRIAPELYIACGISGAIQHMVGCKGAKRILVINTDPQAPILALADYAVIGDVKTVVPALTDELSRRAGASS